MRCSHRRSAFWARCTDAVAGLEGEGTGEEELTFNLRKWRRIAHHHGATSRQRFDGAFVGEDKHELYLRIEIREVRRFRGSYHK
jgi:hypothetical protein